MVLQDFQVSNFCICLGAATYVFFPQNGSFARIHDWLSSCRFFWVCLTILNPQITFFVSIEIPVLGIPCPV